MGGVEGRPAEARDVGFDPRVRRLDLAGAAGGVEEVTAHITRGNPEATAEAEVDVREILADAHAEFEGVVGAGADAGGLGLVGEGAVDVAAKAADLVPDIAAAIGEGILGFAPEFDLEGNVVGAGVELGEHLALGGTLEIGRRDGRNGRAVVVGRGIDVGLGLDSQFGVTLGDVEVVDRVAVKIGVFLRRGDGVETQIERGAFLHGVVDGAETNFVEAVVRLAGVGERGAVENPKMHGRTGGKN